MFDLELFIETQENNEDYKKFLELETFQNPNTILDNLINSNITQLSLNQENLINDEFNLKNLNSSNNFSSTNNIFSELSGKIKFYKKNFENISITNQFENFRYLPINRRNIIFIIAIPINLTKDDLFDFFKPYKNKIFSINFIVEKSHLDHEIFTSELINCTNIKEKLTQEKNLTFFKRAILFFLDQDSTDNFYYEYNTRSFPNISGSSNKTEYLYCSFIDKIHKYQIKKFSENFEIFEIKKNNEIKNLNYNINIHEYNLNSYIYFNPEINYLEISELSTCPLCLERLDTSASGITSIKITSWLINNERWQNYKNFCIICSRLNYNNKINSRLKINEDCVNLDSADFKKTKKFSVGKEENINNSILLNFPCEKNSENLIKNPHKINNTEISNNFSLTNEKKENKIFENLNISTSDNYIKCNVCNARNSLWICLICGVLGCDRYNLGHAVEHYEITYHRYSIDLTHQRIWDYKDDKWVHRVIKISETDENRLENKNVISLEEINYNSLEENLNSKEFLMKIENIISEYNFVLSEQLEQQRLYYENELEKISDKNEENLKNKFNYMSSVNEKSRILNEKTGQFKRLNKEYNKKINQQRKRKLEIEENLKLTVDITRNLQEDIEKAKEKDIEINKILGTNKNYFNKFNKKVELEKQLNELYSQLNEDK